MSNASSQKPGPPAPPWVEEQVSPLPHPTTASIQETTGRQQEAVTDLYERYGKILESVVEPTIKDGARVEWLVQEVFLSLYRDAVRETFDRNFPGADRLLSPAGAWGSKRAQL